MYARRPHAFSTLDPRAKLLAVLAALLICVSTPAARFFAFAAYFAVLALALLLARVSPRVLARRLLALLPMALLCAAFLPFLHPDAPGLHRSGPLILWNIAVKALLSVWLITLLTETTPFPELLRALEQLRFPRLILLLLGFCQRFLFVLRDEAMRMRRAGDARGFQGRWLWHAPVVGRMIGALFLRGYERGERVYLAMAARGFTGAMPAADAPCPWRGPDRMFLAVTVLLFLTFRVALP